MYNKLPLGRKTIPHGTSTSETTSAVVYDTLVGVLRGGVFSFWAQDVWLNIKVTQASMVMFLFMGLI